MATPDMDVIKEIPGYKVILKAILKSQIQQLVQQLASCTEEESVILTANVSDGTLCHLGSDSGKSFLEEKDDFKAQFLGFCLQRHNKKKQEAEREKERQEQEQAQQAQQQLYSPPVLPRFGAPGPVFMPQSPGMSPGMSRGVPSFPRRSRPYPVGRPTRKPQPRPMLSNVMRPPTNTNQEQTIKVEPHDSDSNLSGSAHSQPTSPMSQPGSVDNNSAGPNLSLDSDLSSLMDTKPSDMNLTEQTPGPSSDDPCVKVESISESEFELEITGVELGPKPSGSDPEGSEDNWQSPGGIGGASGNQSDLQGNQQGYSPTSATSAAAGKKRDSSLTPDPKLAGLEHQCFVCGKTFSCKSLLTVHLRVHTGEKPFTCKYCGKGFAQKNNMKAHMVTHLKQAYAGSLPLE